jgi:hypothetical protein
MRPPAILCRAGKKSHLTSNEWRPNNQAAGQVRILAEGPYSNAHEGLGVPPSIGTNNLSAWPCGPPKTMKTSRVSEILDAHRKAGRGASRGPGGPPYIGSERVFPPHESGGARAEPSFRPCPTCKRPNLWMMH